MFLFKVGGLIVGGLNVITRVDLKSLDLTSVQGNKGAQVQIYRPKKVCSISATDSTSTSTPFTRTSTPLVSTSTHFYQYLVCHRTSTPLVSTSTPLVSTSTSTLCHKTSTASGNCRYVHNCKLISMFTQIFQKIYLIEIILIFLTHVCLIQLFGCLLS